MVSDWKCLKYFRVFLYCDHQVHRDLLITLCNPYFAAGSDAIQGSEVLARESGVYDGCSAQQALNKTLDHNLHCDASSLPDQVTP
jgi:hypothetical protein